ncbi:MAG TPA: class I SAM-dependent methyltransferase [Candidatus Eisenbacteria bacterium]|nr:class I SAM-dependent methyltransferase [Candidatus Eisenbacteria bacterium]
MRFQVSPIQGRPLNGTGNKPSERLIDFMNFRSETILLALKHLSSSFEAEPLNVLEIGSMFNENEGLSTFIIADFLHRRVGGGRFVSIDYDVKHIQACKRLIADRNAALLDRVELRHGHSLHLLPTILDDFKTVHFALIDGGALPEVCLEEFEQVVEYLAERGIVLVDDAHSLAPSSGYPLPRPFGKATLIMPMLILADYVRSRPEAEQYAISGDDKGKAPQSRFVQQLLNLEFRDRDSGLPFALIGGKHKMLACGNAEFIAEAEECLRSTCDEAAVSTQLHRIVKRVFKAAAGARS